MNEQQLAELLPKVDWLKMYEAGDGTVFVELRTLGEDGGWDCFDARTLAEALHKVKESLT